MKKLLVLGAIILTVVACKNKEAETDTPAGPTQMEEVVAMHDELMPKMSTIGELISKLEADLDTTEVDSIKIKVIADLKHANHSMMVWMKDFGGSFETDEIMNGAELSEAKKEILDEFESSVHALQAEMQTAIENAQAALEN